MGSFYPSLSLFAFTPSSWNNCMDVCVCVCLLLSCHPRQMYSWCIMSLFLSVSCMFLFLRWQLTLNFMSLVTMQVRKLYPFNCIFPLWSNFTFSPCDLLTLSLVCTLSLFSTFSLWPCNSVRHLYSSTGTRFATNWIWHLRLWHFAKFGSSDEARSSTNSDRTYGSSLGFRANLVWN